MVCRRFPTPATRVLVPVAATTNTPRNSNALTLRSGNRFSLINCRARTAVTPRI